jgi:hypothetical protein
MTSSCLKPLQQKTYKNISLSWRKFILNVHLHNSVTCPATMFSSSDITRRKEINLNNRQLITRILYCIDHILNCVKILYVVSQLHVHKDYEHKHYVKSLVSDHCLYLITVKAALAIVISHHLLLQATFKTQYEPLQAILQSTLIIIL